MDTTVSEAVAPGVGRSTFTVHLEKAEVKEKIDLSKEPIKLKQINIGYWPPVYEVHIGKDYKTEMVVSESPFCNCQIYTIGGFNTFFNNYFIRDRVKEVLRQIQSQLGKSRLLIDIENVPEFHKTITSIFDQDHIVFRQDYTNNTGSEMTIYMLKTMAIGYVEEDSCHEDYEGDYDEDDY